MRIKVVRISDLDVRCDLRHKPSSRIPRYEYFSTVQDWVGGLFYHFYGAGVLARLLRHCSEHAGQPIASHTPGPCPTPN